MNVRKPIDYSAIFFALDALMTADMTQMELYREIGRLISDRPEKGAAVAASEYFDGAYPNVSGFSPRNLRRMRDFYRSYESNQEVLAEAMTIGWTQNVVILEAELTVQERMWYIRAVWQYGWSKLELQRKIAAGVAGEIPLDLMDNVCYTEESVQEQKSDTENERTRLQDQCSDRDRLACTARECPGLAEAGLLPESGQIHLWSGRRPGVLALRPAPYQEDDHVLDMMPENAAKTAYIKITSTNTMADLNRDMEQLCAARFRFVLLDEITLMREFIDSTALLSDIYAAQRMKIVLSETDSLDFWFALRQKLYDRAKIIHTTFIPYREYSRLLGIGSIDEYIRYGGTLRAGELAFEDAAVNAEDTTFRDDETARRYIDTAICQNIQHSLVCYEDGGHFRHLRLLYEAGELSGAINRIIEEANHAFLVSVLTRDFHSHDLGLAARNLLKKRDPEKRTNILDETDTVAVTERLMNILGIRNKREQTVEITKAYATVIKEYLAALDLIMDCPIETTEPGTEPIEHILFTQPGMHYCQAQALVYALMKDGLFHTLSDQEQNLVTNRILERVRGKMLEDIILLETAKASGIATKCSNSSLPAVSLIWWFMIAGRTVVPPSRSSTVVRWSPSRPDICGMPKNVRLRRGVLAHWSGNMFCIGAKI